MSKMDDLLGKKSPRELRRGVEPLDIVAEAARAASPQDSNPSSDKTDEKKPAPQTKKETERQLRSEKSQKPTVFSEKDVQAVLALNKRQTERYSFEIYSDQKADIERVCLLSEKATGQKLSASRLIREVLDTFLPDALKTFEKLEE